MENFKNSPLVKKLGFNRIILCGVLVLMYLLFSIIEPSFVSYSRIISALNYAYFLGFLALGVTFVIATGEIDFSIGPVMFCAALIGGRLLVKDGVPVIVALLVCILVGMLFGIWNGILVAYMGLPSFISSMASKPSFAVKSTSILSCSDSFSDTTSQKSLLSSTIPILIFFMFSSYTHHLP